MRATIVRTVRIVKCDIMPPAWYADKIGEMFEVYPAQVLKNTTFQVSADYDKWEDPIRYILRDDCEEVTT